MRLDYDCDLPLGTRDAVHVPVIAVQCKDWKADLKPGDPVKFIDDKLTEVAPCSRAEAQAFVNPFIDSVSHFENFLVLMIPGVTSPVNHHFEVNFEKAKIERACLEAELESRKNSDPGCADCYDIRNGRVMRW